MEYYIGVLKKYAVFSGRAGRREYWLFVLWNTLIFLALYLLTVLLVHLVVLDRILAVITVLYVLAVIIPSIAVAVRRLHDSNHRGWWFLIDLIPGAGGIVLLIFMVIDGTPGENRFGPDPKGRPTVSAGPASGPLP